MADHTRRTVLTAVGAGLAMSTSATVGGAQNESNGEDESYEEDDTVRVVHLSPDAPPVDIYVDEERAFENVEPSRPAATICRTNPAATASRSRPPARALSRCTRPGARSRSPDSVSTPRRIPSTRPLTSAI